ncbi:MAG: hypothetical protein ACRD96_14590 [Bryobacteraceae bacterium]
MRRLAVTCLALAGCGRYADFTLPSPGAGPATNWRWSAEAAPVLVRGAAGEWDAVDALNPSVVERSGTLFNFYSGYDGKAWHTGLATSPDGRVWRKQGRVLSPDPSTWEGGEIAANGATLDVDGEFHHWYQAGGERAQRIGLATSRDGRQWTKRPEPVLASGPNGSWDERGAGDPWVVRAGGVFYMYYLGQDRARRQRLGVARSRDGARWEKLRSNPVMELGEVEAFDEAGLGEPAVWQSHGAYWMLYTGRDRRERRRLGLARSTDGVAWQRLPMALAGTEAWNRMVLCDPSVLVEGDRVRVWFGGGDVASPDQNLNGQIGLGRLDAY